MARTPPFPDTGAEPRLTLRHRIDDAVTAVIIRLFRLLPYERRVPAMGWFWRAILGPIILNRRVRDNLHHVFPDMPRREVNAICHAVADNFGRVFIELHSADEFARRAAQLPVGGPGLPVLEAARDQGRPVVLASAHFGNYDAWRAALKARGFDIGALYMPMTNPAANRRYLEKLSSIGGPLFPRGPAGMADMVRFLRGGGMLLLLGDHFIKGGELVEFLGKPAWTATSAAKLALKYNALLLPLYATRNPDGLTFTIEIEDPIPHTDALTMTRALNDSASARVMGHMGQWFWLHRRWKRAPDEASGDSLADES
ncbi:MAG: lauroyl acyltransferase [Rhodobacter sp.]|nr:lauroyl acyltransferase [Paracoccaceae bacterium]MCC0077866.1 lauroyl acyltransferase [Rhodobacter sp.]